MKNARQMMILEIIEKYEIGTQEALIQKLREHGIDATQTTVSRDIRQLKLIKGPTGMGTYKYVAPEARATSNAPGHNSALADAVIKIDVAQNIVVVKTHSGLANAIGVCIDTMNLAGIVGSVAGDDTVIIIVRDSDAAARVRDALSEIFVK